LPWPAHELLGRVVLEKLSSVAERVAVVTPHPVQILSIGGTE
jgi:hypothetical protein